MVSYVKPRAEHVTDTRCPSNLVQHKAIIRYALSCVKWVLHQRYHMQKSSFMRPPVIRFPCKATLPCSPMSGLLGSIIAKRSRFQTLNASLPNNFRVPFAIWPTSCLLLCSMAMKARSGSRLFSYFRTLHFRLRHHPLRSRTPTELPLLYQAAITGGYELFRL
jgi:hypothetical protein